VPPQKFDYLLPDEADFLLDNTDGLWHDMILLALKSGLRFGEIIALSWEDVDFPHKFLAVRHAIVRELWAVRKATKSDTCNEQFFRGHAQGPKKKRRLYFYSCDNKPLKQIYCLKNLHRICRN